MQLDVAVLAEQDALIELVAQPRPTEPVAARDRERLAFRINMMEKERLHAEKKSASMQRSNEQIERLPPLYATIRRLSSTRSARVARLLPQELHRVRP
jgi:hypothetical protein